MDLTDDSTLAVILKQFISGESVGEDIPALVAELRTAGKEPTIHSYLQDLLDSEEFVNVYGNHLKSVINENSTKNDSTQRVTIELNFLIQSFTQSRRTFCSRLASKQIPHWLFQLIRLRRNNPGLCVLNEHTRLLANYSLRILLDIIRHYPNLRSSYKKSYGVETVLPFLNVWSVDGNQRLDVQAAKSYMPVRISALLLLSLLVDEDKNKELHQNDLYIRLLVKALNDSLDVQRRPPLYSNLYERGAEELLVGLKNIACPHMNKNWLVGCDAVNILKRALNIAVKLKTPETPNSIFFTTPSSSSDPDTLAELALECLWALAFLSDVSTRLTHDSEFLQLLSRFADDPKWSPDCSRTARNIWHFLFRRHIMSTSWTAGDRPCTSDHSQAGQLVIVYEQTSKQTMLKLRDYLDSKGFLVWMDVENTCTIDVVEKVISRASGVILGLSHAFKNSPYCRYLTQYARELGCEPFLVHLEPDYNSDGWLALYTATIIYIHLTEDSMLPRAGEQLVAQLRNHSLRTSRVHSAHVSPPERRRSCPPFQTTRSSCVSSKKMRLCVEPPITLPSHNNSESNEPPPATLLSPFWMQNGWSDATPSISGPHTTREPEFFDQLCKWDSNQVTCWLNEIGLSEFQTAFSTMDGHMLAELARLRVVAPNYFLKSLHKDMGMSVIQQLRLSAAFTKLALQAAPVP